MESKKHQDLCLRIFSRISEKSLKESSVFAQTKALPHYNSPQPIQGFIPDILVLNKDSTESIIGEAKTEEDINNSHTADQLEAYLSYTASFKKYKIFYEVDLLHVSVLRHLFFKARVSRSLNRFQNIFINGDKFK